MIYVKSFLTGLAAFLVAAVITLLILFARLEMMAMGSGFGVVAGPGWPVLAISLLAFVAGFFWQYRRAR